MIHLLKNPLAVEPASAPDDNGAIGTAATPGGAATRPPPCDGAELGADGVIDVGVGVDAEEDTDEEDGDVTAPPDGVISTTGR